MLQFPEKKAGNPEFRTTAPTMWFFGVPTWWSDRRGLGGQCEGTEASQCPSPALCTSHLRFGLSLLMTLRAGSFNPIVQMQKEAWRVSRLQGSQGWGESGPGCEAVAPCPGSAALWGQCWLLLPPPPLTS